MHFSPVMYHKLLLYNGIYSNNMVQEAYSEYKLMEEKAAARKLMMDKLTSGFKDMFKKQLDIAKSARSSLIMNNVN